MKDEKRSVQAAATTASRRSPRKPKAPSAPQKLLLMFTVIPKKKEEYFLDFLQSFEINLQCAVAGEGTADSERLRLLGLVDSEKSVIISVIRKDKANAALTALEEKFSTIRNGKGIAFTVPMTGMIGATMYRFLCNNREAERSIQA